MLRIEPVSAETLAGWVPLRVALWPDEEALDKQAAEWLAAADVLVHSTGGLTVLEALMRGCPAISYGWGRGHLRLNNEAFLRFDLAQVAATPAELRLAVRRALDRGRTTTTSFGGLHSAASFVLAAARAG